MTAERERWVVKCNLRRRPAWGGGDTSVAWLLLPEAPAVGDVVVTTKHNPESPGHRWRVTERVWVEETNECVLMVESA